MKDIVPPDSKQTTQCYLAVSVNNPIYQQQRKIRKVLEWVSNRYSNCIILVGDFLNRLNTRIFTSLNEEQAIEIATEQGNLIENNLYEALEGHLPDQFTILRWKMMFQNDYVQQRKAFLNEIYKSHPAFRQGIIEESHWFLNRQLSKGCIIVTDSAQAIQLSTEYLLEELAVFSVMIENGYNAQIYPGTTLGILKGLASGKITNVDPFLENGCYIDLSVKG